MTKHRVIFSVSLREPTQISDDNSVQTSTPSTIIPLSEMNTITLNESNNHNYSSPCDQSISISISTDRSSSGTLPFRNIKYILGGKRVKHRKYYPSCLKPKAQQVILNEISGILTPGMNAIMGKN
jgi:hypothetical protein